jgi:predicted secreted protein
MIAALAQVKVASSVIAETGSYSVNHPYTSQGQSPNWQGEQTITLTSGDIEAVLNLAGILQSQGLVMGEMRFFVSPDTLKAVQDELTAAALKEMQGRATTIASDMDLRVARFKAITVGNAQEQVGETPTSTKGPVAGQRSKAPPPAAIAGEALVTLTVNATALLTP